ncbi:biopolymer transporter ExbD [Spirochaetia bacterium]|nr:biopolymer transporter ExbD [Spirochaetia bacterium]
MRNFGGKKNSHTEINITSLIDVIFMLVIFFMIGASFEKPAIALTLPNAASGTMQDRIFVTISVDAEGRVYFDSEEIEKAELAARFAAFNQELRNVTVALECDGGVVFDNVVSVMDIIKLAGVRNVAIRHEW